MLAPDGTDQAWSRRVDPAISTVGPGTADLGMIATNKGNLMRQFWLDKSC
jgi:hypothetical protein